MTIQEMEQEIEQYIDVNIKANIHLRGIACSLVMNHCEDVKAHLNLAYGSEDELRSIINSIKDC